MEKIQSTVLFYLNLGFLFPFLIYLHCFSWFIAGIVL